MGAGHIDVCRGSSEFSGRFDDQTMRARWLLGRTLLERRRTSEARVHLEEALDWYRGKKGDRHLVTIAILVDWARLLQDEGRLEAARTAFEEALGLARAGKVDAWCLGLHLVHYGSCLFALGEVDEARAELTDAHAALVDRFGESDYRARRAEAALAATREPPG